MSRKSSEGERKMRSVFVVPFLLEMILSPDYPATGVRFQYNFEVNISALFTDRLKAEYTSKYITLHLICTNMKNAVCFVYGFDDFYRNSPPFEISFAERGINSYAVDQDKVQLNMMDVYRIIANQLNIGADVRRARKRTYHAMERSNMGECPTDFVFERLKSKFDLNIEMKGLFGFDLEDDMIAIVKYRKVEECRTRYNYSFSARLWPESVPSSVKTEHLVSSNSVMMMASNGMESDTQNTFHFYDRGNKHVGSVVQTVVLKLKSYHELQTRHLFSINPTQKLFIDAFNKEFI